MGPSDWLDILSFFWFVRRPKRISTSSSIEITMATSGRSHGASMVGLARGANDASTCGEKQGVLPAPECKKTSTRMMAKLTRLQHKVADESCCYRGREDPPRTPTDGPTTKSTFCHYPLVTPDSIDIGQSDSDSSDGQVGSKQRQGRELVRVDSSSDGDSSSATDTTETLTVSLTSLGHGPSTPSSSLKSCLSSSTKNFDRRRENGKLDHHRHVQFDSIKMRRYQVVLGDNPEVSVGPPLSLGEWDDSPDFSSFIQHTLLVLTLEMPTKKARGYLLSQFYGRIERSKQSSCFLLALSLKIGRSNSHPNNRCSLFLT